MRADRIPAGPSAKPTLVPGRTMQEELPNPLRADDESLIIPSDLLFPVLLGLHERFVEFRISSPCLSSPVTFLAKKTHQVIGKNVNFFPKLPFLGYLSMRIPLFGGPEVLVPLPALFTGILELCFLSKEGSNALPRNPCPKIKSLHISRLQAEPPQPRLFSGKKRAKGHSQELQALHVKCELDSRIYLKMPQQPKEFHVKAALSHGKCRVSF